jgi:hypothetical protein
LERLYIHIYALERSLTQDCPEKNSGKLSYGMIRCTPWSKQRNKVKTTQFVSQHCEQARSADSSCEKLSTDGWKKIRTRLKHEKERNEEEEAGRVEEEAR